MANPRAWIHVNETAEQMLARMEKERPALFLPPLNRISIRAGNVVEITGPSPSAKSEILLQAAIQCILPKEWNGVHFGGLERVVAYIDLDCRFDVLRLAQVLKLRIRSAYGSAHGTHWDLHEVSSRNSFMVSQADHLDDELFQSCMKRFLYIRCYNSSEFLAALKHWCFSLERSSLPTPDKRCQYTLLVTHKVFLGISDILSSDGRNEEFPTYVCEWIQPLVNISEKFVVRNVGIFKTSSLNGIYMVS